jgi:hypothetical protein
MSLELDHLLVCVNEGAPEAELLIESGLLEGPPNRHPGQGTANRRFFFANAMLELLFVTDTREAQSERTRRTGLWERWQGRQAGSSPFGICLRPSGSRYTEEPPFPAWEYRPVYLPEPHVLHVAETGVAEPMWIYLNFSRRADYEQRFKDHPIGAREITSLRLCGPLPLRSGVAQTIVESGIVSFRNRAEHVVEVEFDHGQQGRVMDFSPQLPIVFRL